MNPWTIGAAGMMAAMLPAGIVCMRGMPFDRLVGLEMAGVVTSMLLVLLAAALGRSIFLDLAVAAALLAFGGGLVFARFFERWL